MRCQEAGPLSGARGTPIDPIYTLFRRKRGKARGYFCASSIACLDGYKRNSGYHAVVQYISLCRFGRHVAYVKQLESLLACILEERSVQVEHTFIRGKCF